MTMLQVQDEWVPRVVVKLTDAPRSYIVRGPSGREYRRNRKHLRRVETSVLAPSSDDDDENESTVQPEQTQETVEPGTDNLPQEPVRTSRGRMVRESARYQDFIKP